MSTLVRRYLYFCHIAVPVVFFGAAALHYRDRLFLRWEFVVLIVIASLPFLLPLLALYIRGVGKDGVFFNNVFSGPVFPPSGAGAQSFTTAPVETAAQPSADKTLSDYTRAARKVLRTLWKFQREHFKDDFSKRWGFGV